MFLFHVFLVRQLIRHELNTARHEIAGGAWHDVASRDYHQTPTPT
jgi:hypothetical protein